MNVQEAHALFERLVHTIAPEADLDEVAPDEPIQEALDLDSMDFLNLVTAIHEATGIDVPERDYPSLSTLAGAVAYLADATQ